ncbi:esterase [Penicillium antarcticum]|uniref:esterase n=1 Tax=Penicillium antarcticum TaxID=416450 RepID=UPI002388F4CE|nr:esterase [Penicillium antarcticum]KAJ5305702.1 esterase [Penicillium antarcticum]
MEGPWSFEQTDSHARNIGAWIVANEKDEKYLIQISWPLEWPLGEQAEVTDSVNAIQLLDGNAMFHSATDIVRRRMVHGAQKNTVIIGISYPLTDSVFSPRRGYDLTPPCKEYNPPKGPNREPYLQLHGGVDAFFQFITNKVRHLVFCSTFPRVSVSETALFGHSYGALFALHALYAAPSSFDAFLAASPSIW